MTDQDHAKIVREARVTQADREAAEEIYDKLCEQFQVRRIKAMAPDDDDLVQAFTRHRLAAEAAAFEKAAGVARMVGERAEKLCLDGEVTEARVAVSLAAEIIGDGIDRIRKLAGEKHD